MEGRGKRGRRLRGGGGGDEAKARLEAAMRKAEAEVRRTQDMEVSLLVKSFFEAPVDRHAGDDKCRHGHYATAPPARS